MGRFAQADTIVPAGVQGYDRYAYVNNNPVKYRDPTGHAADSDDQGEAGSHDCDLDCWRDRHGAGTIDPAPETAQERLDLFDQYISFIGEEDYLSAEKSFAKWIYKSGRLKSDFWNDGNAYILMTMMASMDMTNADPSQLKTVDPAVRAWVFFNNNKTEENFWYAHNMALREAASRSDISEETLNEQVFIHKALNNVLTLGDDCAAGSSSSCWLASDFNIKLSTGVNYPQVYPASNDGALYAMQYNGSISSAAAHFLYSAATGCVGTYVCYP